MRNPGALLCLASGAAFGAMAIFGKLAYEEGATVGTLLAVRFALAALLFWALVARSGGLRRLRTISRRDIALALALGAVGYSAQAGAYFAALRRMDASLLSLLLYTFPAIVTVAAIALGRERCRRRTTAALALASLGLVLVLALPGTGALDPLGTALAISAAVIYSTYLLVSEGVVEPRRPAHAQRARLHRRGGDADRRRGGGRRPRPGRRQPRRLRLARCHRRDLDRRPPSACCSPASGASGPPRRRSSRPPSRSSRSCSRSSSSASRWARSSCWAGRSCSAPRWC